MEEEKGAVVRAKFTVQELREHNWGGGVSKTVILRPAQLYCADHSSQ